jgi:hypothetical protein
MTLRELSKRLKAQSITDHVRKLLSDIGVHECSVYSPPTTRWLQILKGLGMDNLSKISTCVTCYNSDSEVFDKIEARLKRDYKAVVSAVVDDAGYRKVFACGTGADQEPQLILLVNWYENSREEVKALYGESNDSEDPGDEEEGDPFA